MTHLVRHPQSQRLGPELRICISLVRIFLLPFCAAAFLYYPQLSHRISTPENGPLCPFGYGQQSTSGPFSGGTIIYGNGISVFKHPITGAKTVIVVFSSLNDFKVPATTHNAIKIGIQANGDPVFNPSTSPMRLNTVGMDGARFLNPARPADLYISSFQFNAPNIRFANPVDAKVGVQVVQFTPDQLLVDTAVPAMVPVKKYCSPSSGPIVPVADLATTTFSSPLRIKLYNSDDCMPSTVYPTASDPAALGLASSASDPTGIPIPFTRNACNRYTFGGNPRAFKLRCLAGEGSNGIFGSSGYLFKDYTDDTACTNDGVNPLNGIPVNVAGRYVAHGTHDLGTILRLTLLSL